jgi:hypothetical protein
LLYKLKNVPKIYNRPCGNYITTARKGVLHARSYSQISFDQGKIRDSLEK